MFFRVKLRRYNEAIIRFKRALGVNPDYAEAHGNLGGALMKLNTKGSRLKRSCLKPWSYLKGREEWRMGERSLSS
jgi:tetratricopeptide (TPR) repeat protein